MNSAATPPTFAALLRGRLGMGAVLLAAAGLTLHAEPSESPFMPRGGARPAAASPSETLEFAGWNSVGDKTFINIFDKSTKKGRWIAVGGSEGSLSVLAYDPRTEQVVVKSGDSQRTLTLRKSSGIAAAAPAPAPVPVLPPAAAFAQPSVAAINQNVAPAAPVGPVATTEPPVPPKPAEPAKPLTIQRQEEEARMLVSDLLEIGMAQRRAYEEAQKKAAEQATTAPATPTPATSGP